MALRLAQPVDGPAAPQPSASHALHSGAAVAARASALLASRDLAGWRALLDEAAKRPNPQDRYLHRRLLLEGVLAQRNGSAAFTAELFHAGAQAGVEILEADPCEPILLNLTGVLLYELGAIVAAEALFRAAQRLDGGLRDVTRNLRECQRRRKNGPTVPQGLPAAVLRGLRELGPRAQRVAQRAVPAQGLTVSLCMIVKDEEAMLPRCLAAVAGHVDEIVVVDTGSTDRTVEIAESFGARVLHHAWTGDFSAARNVSLDAATGDWLMYLDADEVLVEGDGPRLRELLGRTWREGFYVTETNHVGDLEDGVAVTHNALRVFRNRADYRFEGRVHEQFAHRLPSLPERLEVSPLRVEHFGYLGAVRDAKEKSRRNIELLQRQVADGVDDPFLHFNLGSELAAAGDHEVALAHLSHAWKVLESDPERTTLGYFPSLSARLVRALNANGRHDEALTAGDAVLALLPGFTDVVLEQATARRQLGDADAALALYARCLEMGDAPAKYTASVGAGTFHAGVALADLLLEQGRADEARERLHRVLVEHPGFLGAVEPYARVLVRGGVAPADVVAQVHALIGDAPTPSHHFLLAVPLYEAGAVVEAEAELRAVLAAQPGAHAARVALAEALLSQGRLDEAADAALAVPADALHGPFAATTALFARMAGAAAPDALDAAFAHARAAGVASADLAVHDAWRAGAPAAGSVPAEGAPLVCVMLEALARLEDFDGFERLAAVAEALDLPWRERRELLAGVYLRRGFLDSAAAEWIAAVEAEGPDARAMTGLARIAEARGLAEDAALFRAEAAELEGAKA
jgi:tetratricopeptide (TPR) repeat protein